MNSSYPELNPICTLKVSHKDKGRYIETGIFIVRKSNLAKLKERIRESTIGTIMVLNLLEIGYDEKYNNWIDREEFPCITKDLVSLFIPHEGWWSAALYIAELLQCTKYTTSLTTHNYIDLFIQLEESSLVQLQLNSTVLEHEINILGDEMIIEDITINPKEKLVELNLFSHTNDILGTLWCFERSKELYESKLKMYSDTRVLVSKPLPLSTYELEPDQGVFTHRCVNNPAIFIAKPFSTPPFPLEVNTVNVPTIGSVRKLLDELSGNVQLNVTSVNPEPIVDVEEDLKTVEKILAKYELKLTAEQKCKFLEELVKVLG